MTGLGITALALAALAGLSLLRRSRLLPTAHPALQLGVGAGLGWAALVLLIPFGGSSLQSAIGIVVFAWLALGSWAAFAPGGSVWPMRRSRWHEGNDTRQDRDRHHDHDHHAGAGAVDRAGARMSPGTWLALGLLAGHLILVLTENWLRPTLPWDAWTTWIYRGKAWFFDQTLTPALPAIEWWQQPTAAIAVEANQYPPLVSLLTALVATLDGGWNESSVTTQGSLLAVVLCAVAYGGARTLGLARLMALLATVAMVSLPLVMSHLSLAGYADLWQALYTSTALVLLLIYRQEQQARGHARWAVAGLLLASAGLLVKNEGAIWLVVFIAIALLISQRTRHAALLAAAIGVIGLGLAVWLTPISVTLPLLGTWGITHDALLLGVFGEQRLVISPVVSVYLSQLVAQQNFSILAPLLLAGLVALWIKKHPLAEAASWMVALPIAAQMAIFALTDYGMFAVSGTASARLLLHFVPVWVLITAVGWQGLLLSPVRKPSIASASSKPQPALDVSGIDGPALDDIGDTQRSGAAATRGQTLVPSMLGAVIAPLLCALIAGVWLAAQSPERLTFSVDALQILGGGQSRTESGRVRFTDIQGPVGVMGKALPPTAGERFPLMLADIDSHDPKGLAFFWRDSSGGLNSYPITAAELPVLKLDAVTAWRDRQVIEVGLLQRPLAPHSDSAYPAVAGLTLTDRLALGDWRTVLAHWARPIPVTLRSVNALAAPEIPGAPSANTVLCIAALLLALLKLTLGRRLSSQLIGTAIVTLGLVAIGQNVARQVAGLDALDTPAARLLTGETVSPLANQLQTATNRPILITYFDESSEFMARRLSYQLLPRHAGVVPPTAIPADWRGAIAIMAAADERRAALVAQLANRFTTLASDPQYSLLVPKE